MQEREIFREILQELKALRGEMNTVRPLLSKIHGTIVRAAAANSGSIKDELYIDVKKFVIECGCTSSSMLQEKFGIGYARAMSLIDTLKENRVIRKHADPGRKHTYFTIGATRILDRLEKDLKKRQDKK